MTIQEAIKAHESGKKVRREDFTDGEYVIMFNKNGFTTNIRSSKYDGWEIIDDPLTADELREGISWIVNDLPNDQRTFDYLIGLLNNKRIWES